MLKTPLGRLRALGFVEGTSLLLVLFVTMPLKYLADMPMPNKIVGMTHGVLFLGYLVLLMVTSADREWPLKRTLLGVVASIVPFGPFVFDRSLRREEEEAARAAATAGA